MGQKILLAETFTDATLPAIYDDTIMSAGSLILNDLGHSLGGVTGVQVDNGMLVPNIAWRVANGLVAGAPGQSALSSVWVSNGAVHTPSFPLIERTPKKGLHLIKSQANDSAPSSAMTLKGPAALEAYLIANPTHAFYYSVWDCITRALTTVGPPNPGLYSIGKDSGNTFMFNGQGIFSPASGAHFLGAATTNGFGMALGNRCIQHGVSGVTGSAVGTLANTYGFGGAVGPFSGLHIGSSQILYRLYFEDLTVAAAAGGYTGGAAMTVPARYTELAARDLALFNTAFGVGGKFNGDTFTSPAGYP